MVEIKITESNDPISKFRRDMEQHGSAQLNLSFIEEREAQVIVEGLKLWAQDLANKVDRPIWYDVRVER